MSIPARGIRSCFFTGTRLLPTCGGTSFPISARRDGAWLPIWSGWANREGFHRAARYPEQIEAIPYVEAIAMPETWEDFGTSGGIFRTLRSPLGQQMILDENAFVEMVLPRAIIRK